MRPFWWGFLHPFGPPRPWWSMEKTTAWLEANGTPWRSEMSKVEAKKLRRAHLRAIVTFSDCPEDPDF